jgi:membrane protein YqaA with SNARE-associated domain
VRALFFSVLGYFLTPFGIVLMGVLDASLVFFMPLGIDFVLILMVARRPALFWLYPLLATVGSATGAALTYWAGAKAGEHGLERFVAAKRLKRVTARVSEGAAVSLAALAIIPPPFPFTPVVLACGALEVDAWTFLGALAGVRALRFAIETLLARIYGRQILGWMETPAFKTVVGAFIALAVIGTIVSAIAFARSRRNAGSGSAGRPGPRQTGRAAAHPRT